MEVWFFLFLVARLMAAGRRGLLLPRVGEPAAHFTGTALVVGVVIALIGFLVLVGDPRTWKLGACWQGGERDALFWLAIDLTVSKRSVPT